MKQTEFAMKLYLIRHAESANNAAWSNAAGEPHARKPDPEITDIGHAQSAFLARHIATPGTEPRQGALKSAGEPHYHFKTLYCSLMTRSAQTADYIAAQNRLAPIALPDVFERKGLFDHDDQGNEIGVAGPGRSYFENKFPSLILPDELDENGWWDRPVESDSSFIPRVAEALESIIKQHQHSNNSVALVVHGDFLDQSINYLMNVPRTPANYRSPWVANWVFHNTSVSRIDITDKARNVIYLNRIDHLPAEFVTW